MTFSGASLLRCSLVSLIIMKFSVLHCVLSRCASGIILVHDLSNRKSHQNLRKWLAEVLNKDTDLRNNGWVDMSFEATFDFVSELAWHDHDHVIMLAHYKGLLYHLITWYVNEFYP